jgi:hypothetical protein
MRGSRSSLATDTGDASLGSRDLSGFRVLDLLDAVCEQVQRTLRGDDQAHEELIHLVDRRVGLLVSWPSWVISGARGSATD